MEHHDGYFPSARGSRDDEIDLPRLLRAIRARRSWIVVPTLAAFAAGVAFVTMTSPHYTAFTKVLLENQENYFTRPDKATLDLATAYDPEAVQSEAETVATADLARKAVDKLGLIENPEFNPTLSRNPLSALLSLLTDGPARGGAVEGRVVENFLSRLTVFPIQKSRVLQIEFTSSDPALAARGANAVAELFLSQQEEAKQDQAKAAGAWLSSKIAQLRAKVAEADAKVEAFRADSGLFAGANGMTTPSQQLAEITTQIASARAAQSAAAAKAQLLRDMLRAGRLDAVPEVVKDESLRHYAESRVALKAQIAEESRTLLPGHPRMKELSGQLAGLEEEIRAAAGKAVRGFEDEARLAGEQVSNLEGLIAKQSKAVAASDADGVRLRALELDAKTAREQLESYIDKYREAAARDADNAAPANARVIATAQEPRTPTFPKKLPTILLATLAGFMLSAGVVVARALLRDEPFVRLNAAPATSGRRPLEASAAPADAAAARHYVATGESSPTQEFAASHNSAAAFDSDALRASAAALDSAALRVSAALESAAPRESAPSHESPVALDSAAPRDSAPLHDSPVALDPVAPRDSAQSDDAPALDVSASRKSASSGDSAAGVAVAPNASAVQRDLAASRDSRSEDPAIGATEAIVDRLAKSVSSSGSLTILVTGEATMRALAQALTAARRLSRYRRSVLVDLGLSQSWLGDVFDHAGDFEEGRFGLADLLEGRASFDQALHRDLFARLDILPLGAGQIDVEALDPVLAALAQSYSFVVLHASDWRSPEVAAVIAGVGAVIVCAPAPRLEAVKERLLRTFADPTIAIAGVALAAPAPLEHVA